MFITHSLHFIDDVERLVVNTEVAEVLQKIYIYILSSGLMMQSPLVVNTEVAEVLQKIYIYI